MSGKTNRVKNQHPSPVFVCVNLLQNFLLLWQVPQWKVLLIEAGGDEPTGTQVPSMFLNFLGSSIDWSFNTEPEDMACLSSPERRCNWPRGKVNRAHPNNVNYRLLLY